MDLTRRIQAMRTGRRVTRGRIGAIPTSTLLQYPHLKLDADGKVRIDGTRYKVVHLAGEHHHYGWSAEELLRQHPDLQPEQVYAALTYFYDHRDRLVREMEEAGKPWTGRPPHSQSPVPNS